MTLVLLVLAGCVNLDLDPDPWLIRDWTLDHTRVVAVRAWPPVVHDGQGIALQALALSPGKLGPTRASICGLRTDREVLVEDVSCFDSDDLVEQIADSLPGSWSSPDLSGAVCDVDHLELGMQCASIVPLLVEVEGQQDSAAAADTLAIAFETPRVGTEPPQQLWVRAPPDPVEAGSDVTVSVEVSGGGPRRLQWWVDAGELLESGRTQAWQPVSTEPSDDSISANVVRVPEDWRGPLRVAVVAEGDDFASSSWGMATLWVDEPADDCVSDIEVLAYRPEARTQIAGGWDGDLWVLVEDLDGEVIASAQVDGVDLTVGPAALAVTGVPCTTVDQQVRIVAFVDTNLDADPQRPEPDDIDPSGDARIQIGPGTLHDLAISILAPQ